MNCLEIEQRTAELRMKFVKCSKLAAEDLQELTDILLALSQCANNGTIVQTDYAQTDTEAADFLKNKPLVGGGSSTVVRVNITASQLRSNFPSAPVIEIVPAPTSDSVIDIESILVVYNEGSVSFSNGRFQLNIAESIVHDSYTYSKETIPGTSLVHKLDYIEGGTLSLPKGMPLTFTSVVGNSQGDGNLDIIVKYNIVTI